MGLAISIEQNKKNKIKTNYKNDSVVICSFGDASVNHSTAQGALNTAKFLSFKNYNLPIIFICEDNQIGISTPTPKKWIQNLFINNENYFETPKQGLIPLHEQTLKSALKIVYIFLTFLSM